MSQSFDFLKQSMKSNMDLRDLACAQLDAPRILEDMPISDNVLATCSKGPRSHIHIDLGPKFIIWEPFLGRRYML